MKDNQIENINRYLDNEMSANERKAFEEQLRNDEELAQGMAFFKDFNGYVERQKPELRQDLSDFGDKYIVDPNKNKEKFPRWTLIPILLLIAIIGYFSFFYKKNTPQQKTPPTEIETQSSTNKLEENSNDNSNKNPEETEIIEEQKPNPSELLINQPIAVLDKADFEPNPILEAEIKEAYRETMLEDSTILSAPAPDAEFKFGANITILVEGLTTVSPDYVLNIYSNRPFDFENDYPILNTPMSVKTENNQYRFRFNGNLPLERGLYYLVIKRDDLIEVLYISRFTVK
jgi:hypothetical protein